MARPKRVVPHARAVDDERMDLTALVGGHAEPSRRPTVAACCHDLQHEHRPGRDRRGRVDDVAFCQLDAPPLLNARGLRPAVATRGRSDPRSDPRRTTPDRPHPRRRAPRGRPSDDHRSAVGSPRLRCVGRRWKHDQARATNGYLSNVSEAIRGRIGAAGRQGRRSGREPDERFPCGLRSADRLSGVDSARFHCVHVRPAPVSSPRTTTPTSSPSTLPPRDISILAQPDCISSIWRHGKIAESTAAPT